MLALNPCLNQFLDPVPVARQTISLSAALGTMTGANCDRLVLLDNHQCPVGLVNLGQIVPRWLASDLHQGQYPKPQHSTAQGPSYLKQPIDPDLVLPLRVVSGHQPLSEFLLSEFGRPESLADAAHYTAVNEQGEVLGLLNPARILGFLSTRLPALLQTASMPSAPRDSSNPQPEGVPTFVNIKPQAAGSLRQPFAWQLLAAPAHSVAPSLSSPGDTLPTPTALPEPIDRHPTSQTPSVPELSQAIAPPHPTLPLEPLLELLTRLPLPLMLQTSNGRVLAQTELWIQQAEQLQESQRRPPGSLLCSSRTGRN